MGVRPIDNLAFVTQLSYPSSNLLEVALSVGYLHDRYRFAIPDRGPLTNQTLLIAERPLFSRYRDGPVFDQFADPN